MNNSDWLDIDLLEDYLDGKLDAKTMHRVERLSLEDPFVAEALAGLSLSPKRIQSLSLLQKQLQERIAQKPVEQKRWQITSQRLSIAAAAAVLFVTVSLLFWMREKGNRDQLAANSPKSVEVAIAPKQMPKESITKTKEEVNKVIAETKSTVYAANANKAVKKSVNPTTPAVLEDATVNAPILAKENKVLAFRAIEVSKKNEVANSQIADALQGRVAGLKIKNDQNSVNGIVYGEDKLPIAGAIVKLKGASSAEVTNEKGEFKLRLDSLLKDQKLAVTYLGFQPQEVIAKKGENLTVELKADNSSLNEVVIVGYDTQKRRATTGATSTVFIRPEPVGGWDKFQAYLVNNNRLLVDKKPIGKHITVAFELKENGKPINISALPTLKSAQPLSDAEQKEVVRLFTKGPKWVLPANNSSGSTTVNIII